MHTVSLATLLLSLLLAAPAAAQCTKDTDCKGQRICVQGICLGPDSATRTTFQPAAPAVPVAAATYTAQAPQAPVQYAPAPAVAPALARSVSPPSREWFRGYGSLATSVGTGAYGGAVFVEDKAEHHKQSIGTGTGFRLSGMAVLRPGFHLGGFLSYLSVDDYVSTLGVGVSMKAGGQVGSRVFLSAVIDLGYHCFGPDLDNSADGLVIFPRFQVDIMTIRGGNGFKWALYAALGTEIAYGKTGYTSDDGDPSTLHLYTIRPTLLMGTTFGG